MAFVRIREASGRSTQLVGMIDNRYSRRQWIIEVDDITDDAFTVGAFTQVAAVLPSFNDAHPGNPFWKCRAVVLEDQRETHRHWVAIADYSTAPLSNEEKQRESESNPINRPVRLSIDSVDYERYVTKDRDGNPLLNSAEDPYPPQAEEDDRTVVLVEVDVSTWTTAWLFLRKKMNTNAVTITDGVKSLAIPAETAFMKSLKISTLKEENGHAFYTVSMAIHVRENADEWDLSLLDEGFNTLSGSTKTPIKLDGEIPTEAVLLDGSGGELAAGGTAAFNDFKMKKLASWSTLPGITE